jgi:hypothetical protein
MSAEAPTPVGLFSGDIEGLVKQLDEALLSMVLMTATDGSSEEMFRPMQLVAGVRAVLNDVMDRSDDEGEADHG